jgi:dihydroflavonol-4-reductase
MDETQWTELDDGPPDAYTQAKTLAERDAWELVRGRGRMELTSVLPGFIQGPVLGADYSGSVNIISMMLRGTIPAVPRLGFNIVDVRDVAALHVRAMLAPAAAGERFIAAGEFLWLSDIAALLLHQLGKQGAKAPTRVMPDWIVRSLGPLNPDMAQIAPDLGVQRPVDASKAQRLLGWQTRPAAESIIDAAKSMIEQGLV